MKKIDFFGGLHGNYLELVINVFVEQIEYDLSEDQFNALGACHIKHNNKHYNQHKGVHAMHWSYNSISFGPDDQVIRITIDQHGMLIGVTNSILRAGDQTVELDDLEKNTLQKLKKSPKLSGQVDSLVADYGIRDSYPRSALRNYFYSMFTDPEHGTDIYNKFDSDTPDVYNFDFMNFFNPTKFYQELNNIAYWFNLNFYSDSRLGNLHQEFLEKNQGWHSYNKCQNLIQLIFQGKSTEVKCNILEEAWINTVIAKTTRCYDLPLLTSDHYPTDTKKISDELFRWKQQDR
jgi:hypothetical protein